MKTSKSYRLSNWALNNIDSLKSDNLELTETEIVEWALSLAVVVTTAWNHSPNKDGIGKFKLDNDAQATKVAIAVDKFIKYE